MTVPIQNINLIFKDCEKKCIKACINTVNIQAAMTRKNAITTIGEKLTLRNKWTTSARNLRFDQCPKSVTRLEDIKSEVGSKLDYMERQEKGGARKPSGGSKRLAIPSTTARGGSNSKTVRQKYLLSGKKMVVHGAFRNSRASVSSKSRYVARAFVANREKILLSSGKTLFTVSSFKKSGSSVHFNQTPIYNLKFSQTQTPAKPWLEPATKKPMQDGQNIFNREADKIFATGK